MQAGEEFLLTNRLEGHCCDFDNTERPDRLKRSEGRAAKIDGWKKTVKQAKTDVLQLAASAPIQGGTNIPEGLGNVKIDVPKTDPSARMSTFPKAFRGMCELMLHRKRTAQ